MSLLSTIAAAIDPARDLRVALDTVAADLGAVATGGLFDALLPIGETSRSSVEHLGTERHSGISVYLVADPPGEHTPAHEHHTWALTVGLAGVERNQLFVRAARGRSYRPREVRELGRGDTLVLLADEAHATTASRDRPTCHLHMYGRPLSMLSPFEARLIRRAT